MAKEVGVENHVLRYWEEELGLEIKRNETGHRYYAHEDVELYKKIKEWKDGVLTALDKWCMTDSSPTNINKSNPRSTSSDSRR